MDIRFKNKEGKCITVFNHDDLFLLANITRVAMVFVVALFTIKANPFKEGLFVLSWLIFTDIAAIIIVAQSLLMVGISRINAKLAKIAVFIVPLLIEACLCIYIRELFNGMQGLCIIEILLFIMGCIVELKN
jgi:hypothetical protein